MPLFTKKYSFQGTFCRASVTPNRTNFLMLKETKPDCCQNKPTPITMSYQETVCLYQSLKKLRKYMKNQEIDGYGVVFADVFVMSDYKKLKLKYARYQGTDYFMVYIQQDFWDDTSSQWIKGRAHKQDTTYFIARLPNHEHSSLYLFLNNMIKFYKQ